MTTRLLTVSYGPPATALLGRLVAGARERDPLAPVTVVVPSAAAGVSLRRRLALDLGGIVNVSVSTFPQLVAALARPFLAESGRRPLPDALARAHRRAAISRSGLVDDQAVLASAATERAVEASLGELALLDDHAVEALARRGGTTAAVVDVHRRVVASTAAAGYAGPAETRRAAVDVLAAGRADLDGLGPVVLHLPRRVLASDLELLGALVDAGAPVTAVVGRTGHRPADDAADALVARLRPLFGPDNPADALATPVPPPVELVRVPDPTEEVAVAVRRVVAAVTGAGGAAPVPAERVAVVSRVRDPYAAIVHERLSTAGIPHHAPSVTTVAQSVPGRVLLGLLEVAAGGMRRTDVAALLRAGPLVDPRSGRRVPAPYWDRLAREAGVIGGLEQWRDRLGRAAAIRAERVLAWEARSLATDPEQFQASRQRAEVDAVAALADDRRHRAILELAAFVDDLADRLGPPAERRWHAWSAWAEGLLEAYLDPARSARHEAATEIVTAAVAGLADLDGVDVPPDPERFRRVLEAELDRPDRPHGRFGHGVLVGRLVDVAGADLDLVIVLGGSDGALPPRRRDDALVPERERTAAGGALPPRGLRREEEHRDLLAALAAAPVSILISPRADPREQRERQPAPWFLDLVSDRAGRLVGSDELGAVGATVPWFTDVASFEAGVVAGREPAAVDELDLADLVAEHRAGAPIALGVVASDAPALRRGLEAAASRRAGAFDEWSGRVGDHPELLDVGRPRSPTGLERYATCPFRSFLADVLNVAAVDDPTEAELLSPLDEGSLVHEVLERFVGAHVGKPPSEPWTDAEREQLVRIADEVADRYEGEGRTGRALLWRVRRAQIHHQLQRFLDRDEVYRAEHGVSPAEVELPFGIDTEPDLPAPVGVDLPGERRLVFRGVIDRVDRSPDGRRLVVSDYKTGKPDPFRSIAPRGTVPDLTARGTKLQLPIYALAARARFPEAETVEARYWFVGSRGEGTTIGGEYDEAADARFREVVTTVVDGVEAGQFPANPGGEDYRFGAWTHDNCSWCEFDRVCPTTRGEAWVQLRRAPELRGYVALAEAQDPEDPEDSEDGEP